LAQKQPKQAYALLLPQEAARAGDPEFDYLLGLAALDSGELERAVFALERVLAVQPDNHLARAEIARAYLEMGARDAARQELEAALRHLCRPFRRLERNPQALARVGCRRRCGGGGQAQQQGH